MEHVATELFRDTAPIPQRVPQPTPGSLCDDRIEDAEIAGYDPHQDRKARAAV